MTDDLNLTHTKFNLETRAIQNTARLVERPRRGDGEGERVQERGVRLGEVLEAGPARAQEPAEAPTPARAELSKYRFPSEILILNYRY